MKGETEGFAFPLGVSNADQALVEDSAVCVGAGAFWNMGRRLHLLHDQHFWSSSFPEDGMARGEC